MAIDWYVRVAMPASGRSPCTVRAYASDLSDFARHVGARTLLASLVPNILESWVAAMKARGLSAATTKRRIAAVKSFFARCEEAGLGIRKEMGQIRIRIRLPRLLPRAIGDGDVRALLSTSRSEVVSFPNALRAECSDEECRRIAIVEVLLASGLRVGEVAKIDVRDVLRDGLAVRVVGKGSRERLIYLGDPIARGSLNHYLAVHRFHRESSLERDALFVGTRGRRLTTAGLRSLLRNHATRVGVAGRVTPHMLRHTAAGLMLRAGIDVRLIQEVLGHASLTMTQRYTEVSASAVEEAVCRRAHLAPLRCN